MREQKQKNVGFCFPRLFWFRFWFLPRFFCSISLLRFWTSRAKGSSKTRLKKITARNQLNAK
jgi:hypothetical protein